MLDKYLYMSTQFPDTNSAYRRETFIAQESNLPRTVFSVEKSTLPDINANFPKLEGRRFTDWLDCLGIRGNVRILEVGGGINQEAAREILERYPTVTYTAIEPRPLSAETAQILTQYPNYEHQPTGISSLVNNPTKRRSYNLVFAHYVAEHLPDPVALVEETSKLLTPNGLLFYNRLPFYDEEFEGFVKATQKQQGTHIAYKKPLSEGSLLKAGIVRGDIAIQIGEAPLSYTYRIGSEITDYSGKTLPTREIFFPKAA